VARREDIDVISVMGASGHIGGRISELLLESGEKVRALGRSAQKLATVAGKGATVLTGDAGDTQFLTTAFRDANAAFTLLPPDVHASDGRRQQDAHGEAIVAAIRGSGLRFVVFLSSIGADQPEGTGPIAGLHAQEERLRRLPGVNVLIMRPTYFFENFFETLGLIKQQGINGGAIAPDLAFPMIATRDIADVAAGALRRRDWQGVVVRELLGERDLTFSEATRIIGARIGKPDLPYVQFPYADFTASLVQMGISPDVARLYTEMARAINDGRVKSREGRRPENTTPTRFEDFVETLARAYQAA
jgi:uncharacterized protein YbjT (DUF2867 family)